MLDVTMEEQPADDATSVGDGVDATAGEQRDRARNVSMLIGGSIAAARLIELAGSLMHRRRVASSIALLAAGLAVAACGSGSPAEPPEDAVRKTATQYAKALADGDADKACDLMSSAARQQIVAARAPSGGRDCPATMRDVVASLDDSVRDELRDYRVTNVEIKRDRASVVDNAALDTGEDHGGRRAVRKEGGRWLMAGPDQVNKPGANEGDDTAGP
jgi:predicted small lipoprotein YifL